MSTRWPFMGLFLSMGELLEDLEWILVGDFYLCPDCKQPNEQGHAEDCGLRALLNDFQDKTPDAGDVVEVVG